MTDEELTQAMAELQEVVRCHCDEAFRDRGLQDPQCQCDSAEAVKVVARRIKALEAKMAKAVEIGNKMAHSIEGNYYLPNIAGEWRKVAAEIKGESHE